MGQFQFKLSAYSKSKIKNTIKFTLTIESEEEAKNKPYFIAIDEEPKNETIEANITLTGQNSTATHN